jgi:hypothetical protein
MFLITFTMQSMNTYVLLCTIMTAVVLWLLRPFCSVTPLVKHRKQLVIVYRPY